MNVEFAGVAAAWLITFTAHSCALIGVGLVLTRVCRWRGSESGEEAVWRVAVFAALATATAQMLLVEPRWPLLDHIGYTADGFDGLSRERSPLGAWDGDRRWPVVVVHVALLVSALRSVVLSVARLRLARFLRHRRAEAGHAQKALHELVTITGSRLVPRLTVHNGLGSPVAFGVLRPEIAIPAWALELQADTLRSLLAHELAHLCRRDPLWRVLLELVEVLFPWQVLIRPVRRRLETIAEFRCDNQAAVWTGAAATARSLVVAAVRMGQPTSRQWALAGMTVTGPLDRRVDRLLCNGPDWKKGSRWSVMGLLVFVGVMTPVLPGVTWDRTERSGDLRTLYAASEPVLAVQIGNYVDTDVAKRPVPAVERCEARKDHDRWEGAGRQGEHLEAHHNGRGRQSCSITTP